jgi:beta-carotene ketolase (CrtW type)
VPGADPDFHGGAPGAARLGRWFGRFMWHYASVAQMARIAAFVAVLDGLGVPRANIYLFLTAAPLLSAFRLFYFGTYLPHRPPPGEGGERLEMGWRRSGSTAAPALLSLLAVYHFGIHWEHHRWPYAPWWHLPRLRRLRAAAAAAAAAKKAS